MNARKYIFFGYMLYCNIINYIVCNFHNPKPKDHHIYILGLTIAIRLTPLYIDVNSIGKHIRKLFFIESKVMKIY